MIRIENVDVYGWIAAIRGARNPMNSWNQSDTSYGTGENEVIIGPRDLDLLRRLANAGPDHGKFLRTITVTVDIVAPMVWWAEFDTYKVGTVRNSCSKMHKIHVKDFTNDDFSHEGIDQVPLAKSTFNKVIATCERLRMAYNKTRNRKYWRALIELLPEGYNMRATVHLNYAVLRAMYHARKNHKLGEWRKFCAWIETLPHAELITGGDVDVRPESD